MTTSENAAIKELSRSLDRMIEENRSQHTDIKESIRGIWDRVDGVETHCHERAIEVDAALAKHTLVVDAEIAAAKVETKAEAVAEMAVQVAEIRKPSVYKLATKGAFEGLVRFALKAAVIAGLLSSIVVLMDKLGLL